MEFPNRILYHYILYILYIRIISNLSSKIQSLEVDNEDIKGILGKYKSELGSVKKSFIIIYAKIASVIKNNNCIILILYIFY